MPSSSSVTVKPASSTAFGRMTTRVATSTGLAARASATMPASAKESSFRPAWATADTSKTR